MNQSIKHKFGVAPRPRFFASLRMTAGRLQSGHIFRLAFCLSLLWLAFNGASPLPVRAQGGGAPEAVVYTLHPGDTLPALALRFGTDVRTLARLNDLRDPRQVYPGQQLRLPLPASLDITSWEPYRIEMAEDFLLLSRRARLNWEVLAQANRALIPHHLMTGQEIHLPPLLDASAVSDALPVARIVSAIRYAVPYWRFVALNPLPDYAGTLLLIPGTSSPPNLPSPLVALAVMPQPVPRGNTAVVLMETSAPASCEVTYLDRVEACYTQGDRSLFALLGLPPTLDPGRYEVALRVWAGADSVTLPLTLSVTEGRYDFERLDLPPSRESLLDPALSQVEREKIAALRTLRSPDRLWEFPFQLPLSASVTSYFGSRRSYGGEFNSLHGGTDFRSEIGTPVSAPASGTVILAEPLVVRGNAILIDHGGGIVSGYWHLSRIDVVVGQTVTQGERIGAVGNTGMSTGPHLHWEMWVNGVAVSPLQWVTPFAAFSE